MSRTPTGVAETVRCSPQSHSHNHRTLLNLVWARSITVQRPNFRSVRSMSRMANQLGVCRDARDLHGLSPGVRPRPSYLHLLVSAVFQFGFPPSQHAAGFTQSSRGASLELGFSFFARQKRSGTRDYPTASAVGAVWLTRGLVQSHPLTLAPLCVRYLAEGSGESPLIWVQRTARLRCGNACC